jgi:hypothetical protein
MNDIQHPSDFQSLTGERILAVVECTQAAVGGDVSRTVLINHLPSLLEDMPGECGIAIIKVLDE